MNKYQLTIQIGTSQVYTILQWARSAAEARTNVITAYQAQGVDIIVTKVVPSL